AGFAVLPDLRDVAPHRLPASDLARIVAHAAAHEIAAVPLEPAAWIVRVNPALAAPFRQRLAGVDAEIVERAVAACGCEFGPREPGRGKLVPAIGEVAAAEDAELEHLLRGQLRP